MGTRKLVDASRAIGAKLVDAGVFPAEFLAANLPTEKELDEMERHEKIELAIEKLRNADKDTMFTKEEAKLLKKTIGATISKKRIIN